MANQNGDFGTMNVTAATNVPSARGFSTVQNISGNVWLFGGFGNDSAGTQDNLNDLWEYTISSGEWTWVGGSNLVDEVGVYGTKGTAAPGQHPGVAIQSRYLDGYVGKLLAFRGQPSGSGRDDDGFL